MGGWWEELRGTHLQDEEEDEVGVGHPLELFEEVEWEECENVVFGGLDCIGLKNTNNNCYPDIHLQFINVFTQRSPKIHTVSSELSVTIRRRQVAPPSYLFFQSMIS